MKVTLGLLQHACVADPRANQRKTLALIERAAKGGAQIICTQELFRSQYFCQAEDYANFALAEPVPVELGPLLSARQLHGEEGHAPSITNICSLVNP